MYIYIYKIKSQIICLLLILKFFFIVNLLELLDHSHIKSYTRYNLNLSKCAIVLINQVYKILTIGGGISFIQVHFLPQQIQFGQLNKTQPVFGNSCNLDGLFSPDQVFFFFFFFEGKKNVYKFYIVLFFEFAR